MSLLFIATEALLAKSDAPIAVRSTKIQIKPRQWPPWVPLPRRQKHRICYCWNDALTPPSSFQTLANKTLKPPAFKAAAHGSFMAIVFKCCSHFKHRLVFSLSHLSVWFAPSRDGTVGILASYIVSLSTFLHKFHHSVSPVRIWLPSSVSASAL